MKKVLYIIICMNIVIFGYTQKRVGVKDLYESLFTNVVFYSDTLILKSEISQSKPIVFTRNSSLPSFHLGISLFSKETKELINKPVCNFIERLMLEAVLCKNKEEVRLLLESRKIELRLNGRKFGEGGFTSVKALLEEIDQPSSFRLANTDGKFMAVIDFGVFNSLEMIFPASRELIFGTDKKESDEEVCALLKKHPKMDLRPIAEMDPSSLQWMEDSLYVEKGNVFMIDSICSDHFFLKEGNEFVPLYKSTYPSESFKNILLGVIDADKELYIRHRMYGNYSPDFTISVSAFLDCFREECTFYCGTHRMQNGKLQGVLIVHNALYNFIHMLIVTTDETDLFRSNTLNADLYTNIPQHYIKSLF